MPKSASAGRDLVRQLLRQHRAKLTLSVLLLSLWTAGEALVPAVVGATIDAAIARPHAGLLALWLGLLVLTFAALSYGYRYGSRIANTVLNRETHVLRTRVADRALDPRGTTTPRLPGEVAALASVDAEVTAASVRQVAMGASAGIGLLVCSAYLLLTNVWLGALVLVLVPLSLVLLKALTPLLTQRTGEHQESIAAAAGSVADLLRGVTVLRGIGGEAEASSWYRTRSLAATRAAIRTAGPSGRLEAVHVLVSGLLLMAVAALGGWQVLQGRLTPGDLIGTMGVAAFLSTPIGTLVALAEGLARSRAAADRIAEFLAEKPLRTGEQRPAPDAAAPLLLRWGGEDAVRVPVRGGSFVAIVCADATAPARFEEGLELADGSAAVEVAGTELGLIHPEHAPSVVQLPPHLPQLFGGSLRYNVAGSPRGAVSERVLAASGVDQMLQDLLDGAEHGVHEGGENLSGGQRQRVALARALSGAPVPRVLMEPTTAVDSVTEAQIAEGLRAWRGPGPAGESAGESAGEPAVEPAAAGPAGEPAAGPAPTRATLAIFTSSPALAGAADAVAFVDRDGAVRHGTHHELMHTPDYREAVGR